MRILIIEDDHALARAVRQALERDGNEVAAAERGATGLDLVRSWQPEIVLLDLSLPDADGRDLARTIRATSEVPIIMVTGRDEVIDRITGLELGADDYITKPFDVHELVARVRAVSRRTRPERAVATQRLTHADLTLDTIAHRAWCADQMLSLSPKEFELLRMLIEQPGTVLRRGELAQAIWGEPAGAVGKTIDVHVSSLRRKLGDDAQAPRYIETVRGIGFRLLEE